MIYWFTGQSGHGKTALSFLLKNYLEKTYHRNLIHIDDDDLKQIHDNLNDSKEGQKKNIKLTQNLVEFCSSKGFDVVLSVVSPYKVIRDEFKEKFKGNIYEIYVHASETRGKDDSHNLNFEPPTDEFIEVDTTYDTLQESLNYITSGIGL